MAGVDIRDIVTFQSTHPHGVRHYHSSMKPKLSCFNPRTRTGCDQALEHTGWPGGCFNPRTRTGCDLSTCMWRRWRYCFNPRTRTGCDAGKEYKWRRCEVSIHAPARGATYWHPFAGKRLIGFNPRTRTGCDHIDPVVRNWEGSFNPRTRTGCDLRGDCVR